MALAERRFPPPWFVDHSQSPRRVCSIRIFIRDAGPRGASRHRYETKNLAFL
jgi:hypothetical protein